jgi:caffeoyl-CoA O-methyltransferase
MFHDMPRAVVRRMRYLERMDARHRKQDMTHFNRLRQVPPAAGKFLALLAAAAPDGSFLEIGTSGGYSGLWLALACRAAGRRLVTFEISEQKVGLAKETFRSAGVEDVVEVVEEDARDYLRDYRNVAFCFLDAEKVHYWECYQSVAPNLVPGGILVADNVLSHMATLKSMVGRVLRDKRVDSLIVPIGSGMLVCRKA